MKKRMLSPSNKDRILAYGIAIVAYIVMQILMKTVGISSSLQGQLVPICAYIVMAVSLNLTVGVLGELSLGHAGFMSVGAFTGVVVSMYLKNSIPNDIVRLALAFVFAALFAAVAGVIVGVPALRLKGDYLAIVTLAFGEIIKNLVNVLYIGMDENGLHFSMLTQSFTLGEGGKMLVDGPMGASGVGRIATFTSGFVVVLITLFIVLNFMNSRAGRAVMAIRDNTIAAESVGIPVTRYKLLAFVVSAALAGMAGALYGVNYSTVVATKFDFNTSILVLVFVVLGGLGNIWGSIIAAALLTVLPEVLRSLSDYRMLIYAILLIAMMLFNNSNLKKRMIESRAAKREEKRKGRA